MGGLLDTDTFSSWISSLLMAHAGTFIVFGIAPIAGCLILEGLVLVLRERGIKPLLVAFGLFVATIAVGFAVRDFGLNGVTASPSYLQDVAALERNASMYLTFSIPLGLIAATIRVVRSLVMSR